MSFAGPREDRLPQPAPSPAPAGPRRPVLTRRRVLGVAIAGGTAVAAARLLGLGSDQVQRLERLVPGARALPSGRGDWISPLSAEPARIAHLLRRTTFGATAAELEAASSLGFSRTVDRLLETKPAPPPDFIAAGDQLKGSRLEIGRLQQWWADWMLNSPTPFAERMTLFWHGHFTSDYRKVGNQQPFIYWQNLTWRDMGLTDLRSMVMRVTTDPAMLRYLDLATSTGAAPNENYSRELLELFTMGVGSYREDDVRAVAKALAGWTQPKPSSTVQVTLDAQNKVTRPYAVFDAPAIGQFVPGRAYKGGPLTLLGKTGKFDTQAVIDRILAQPATAPFIAGRVAEHFVSPNVDKAYVRRLGDSFRASKYDVKTLMKAVFTSPEFLAAPSYRALVKSPTEFMVHTLKALGLRSSAKLVVSAGANQGQVLFDPPDVGGWPNNDSWISSNSVMARVNFVTQALAAAKSSLPSGGQAPGHIDTVLSAQTAALLNQAPDDRTRWFLTLASPEFQLK